MGSRGEGDPKLKTFRDRALFDRIARAYARKDLAPSSAFVRRQQLLRALAPILASCPQLGTVLELGCGVAAPAWYLFPYYDRYLGVDHSEEMIRLARGWHAQNPKVAFLAGDAASVDLGDLRAQVVLAIGALHHMVHPNQVLAHISRFVAPGAHFVAIEPQSGNPAIQLLRRLRARLDPGYSRDQRFFSPGELERLFAESGWADIQVEPEGYFSTPFAQVVMPGQWWAYPAARLMWACDLWLARHLPAALARYSWNLILRARWPGVR